MTKKLFKSAIAFAVCFCVTLTNMSGAFSAFAQNDDVLSMDFEEYELGDTPSGFTNCEIARYEGSKALKVNAKKSAVSVKLDKFIMGEYCISFDIAAPVNDFDGTLKIASGGDRKRTAVSFSKGEIFTNNNKSVGGVGKSFKNITVVINPVKKWYSLYLDNKQCFDKAYIDALSDKCMNVTFSFTSASEVTEIFLDNIVIHSTGVRTDMCSVYNPDGFTPEERVVNFTSERRYPSDYEYIKFLGDRAAIHMRSGVVFKNGEKSRLNDMPYVDNGESMVSADGIEMLLNTKVSVNDSHIIIGDNRLRLNEKYLIHEGTEIKLSSSPVLIDSVLYLPLYGIAKYGFSKNVYSDTTTISSGMVIIGENEFYPPGNADSLQKLNDYLFYIRPDGNDIYSDYQKSDTFLEHPRVMTTKNDISRIKEEVKTNEIKKAWYDRLIEYADKIIDARTLVYELRDGVRLMYVSDDFEGYMLCLGMAYQLTGDKKYSDGAWKQIEAVSAFPDWNPAHQLDIGIMATGFAVAYDWMYDCWNDEQKRIMEEAVYRNCFYDAAEAYKSSKSAWDGIQNSNNINAITNCGVAMSALAFMDVYPEETSTLCAESIRYLEYMIYNFAPFGAWYEGPSYAGMTLDYLTRMFSSLETSLNNLYCLDQVEGVDRAAEYLTYVQSDVSCYNFADSEMGTASTPGLFWLFHHYNLKGLKESIAALPKYTTNYNDALVHCLQWYDVDEETGEKSIPLDKHYEGDEIITMRNNYSSGQVFAGIKAGDTVYEHSHLDSGSFVFDALGVRWAYDMGKDNYNLSGYFDMSGPRWNIFRLRPEAHNTVVINPDTTPGYVLGSRADVTLYEEEPRGVKTVIDMSKLLADNATAAKRGYLFTDDRTSLVVRDELTLKNNSNVYWFMYTKADAKIDGNNVILTDKTDSQKQIKIEFASSQKGAISYEKALPLETSPVVDGQMTNDGFYRLSYKMTGSGNASVTAKITPLVYYSSSVKEYNMPIDNWKIPEGELKPIPELDELVIGDISYSTTDRFIKVVCDDEQSPIPPITAKSDKYQVEIKMADTPKDKSYVLIRDPENPKVEYTYTISYDPKKVKRVIDGYDVAEMISVDATEEPQVENPAVNVIDGKPGTRWSAENEQSLYFVLDDVTKLDTYIMSMYSGNTRQTYFDVFVSDNGTDYNKVYSGATSGTTNEYEAYDIGEQETKYIRVDFHGASNTTWNSVSEVVVAKKK